MNNQFTDQYQSQYRQAPMYSYIRVLHASPDAPAVDIYVNNVPAAFDVTYKEFTQYFPLVGGLYNIKVYRKGTQTNPVINTNVNIPPSSIFTVAASGMLANIGLELVQEPPVNKVPGQALVRVAHLSPNTPNVDITLPTGTKLFSDVEYGEITDYIPVRPGSIEFQARLAGTDKIILTVPNIRFKPGNIYTVYVVGLQNGQPPLQVLIPLDGSTYLNV